MTAQSMETIFIDGKKHFMASEPFGQYLMSITEAPDFYPPNTACWRGYTGTWKIEDDRLYLVSLNGYIKTQEKEYQGIDMNYFFPHQKSVFAEWFSGEIRIPEGKMVQYIHMGYESLYEKDLLLKIEKGIIVNRLIVENI